MKLDSRPLIALVIVFLALHVLGHILAARWEWNDYRDQHLGTALIYARDGIDFLKPVIPGFNANNASVPQEPPIWQAAVAIAFKTLGTWWGWANLVSLVFFLSGLWPLYRLSVAHGDARRGWWTLFFFCAQPIVLTYSGAASNLSFSFVLAIWFLWAIDEAFRTGRFRWYAVAAIFGALSATAKAPYFMAVGLASFFLQLLSQERKAGTRWLGLIAVGGFSVGSFALWNAYAFTEFSRAEFPFVELRVSHNPGMSFWYFGDWAYRLNPAVWLKGAWRFLTLEFGSIVLVGLIGLAFCFRWHRLAFSWLLGGFVTTAIFSQFVFSAAHYNVMVSGAVALACAEAAAGIEERILWRLPWHRLAAVAGAGLLIFLSSMQGLIDINSVLLADPFPRKMGAVIRSHSTSVDKLLIQGGGWGGDILLHAEREGLSIWDTHLLEKPENLARLKSLGFNKLVMISESPLLAAVQVTKPGQMHRERDVYQKHMTQVVKDWPVVLENDDILIKLVP